MQASSTESGVFPLLFFTLGISGFSLEQSVLLWTFVVGEGTYSVFSVNGPDFGLFFLLPELLQHADP